MPMVGKVSSKAQPATEGLDFLYNGNCNGNCIFYYS